MTGKWETVLAAILFLTISTVVIAQTISGIVTLRGKVTIGALFAPGAGLSSIQFDANPALTGDVIWTSGTGLSSAQSGQMVTVSANQAGPSLLGVLALTNDLGGTAVQPTARGLHLAGVAFDTLLSDPDGTVKLCSNCDTPATPGVSVCSSSGDQAGAEAHRIRGAWVCW